MLNHEASRHTPQSQASSPWNHKDTKDTTVTMKRTIFSVIVVAFVPLWFVRDQDLVRSVVQ